MRKFTPSRLALLALVIGSAVARAQEVISNGTGENAAGAQAGTLDPSPAQDGPVYFWEKDRRVERGETQLAFYGGQARTQSSDIRFRVNGNSDMTYHNVPWFTDAFGTPPYYGARLSHFFAANPHWGLMIDYTHDKAIADRDVPLSLTGVRNGQAINTRETLGQTLSHLEMTDGVNFLTFNAVYRGFLFTTEERPRGWLQPYIGGGIGMSFPSVETTFIGGPETHRYEWRGPAFQGMIGTHVVLTKPLSLFVEYKFNNILVNGNIREGTMRTVINSHQFLIGPSLNW